jgi:hypothetical protein
MKNSFGNDKFVELVEKWKPFFSKKWNLGKKTHVVNKHSVNLTLIMSFLAVHCKSLQ